jgi:small-conductance mechanosensitive channel
MKRLNATCTMNVKSSPRRRHALLQNLCRIASGPYQPVMNQPDTVIPAQAGIYLAHSKPPRSPPSRGRHQGLVQKQLLQATSFRASIAGLLLLSVLCGETFAQTVPQISSRAVDKPASHAASERVTDLQALDQVLTLLRNDKARAQLVADLEKLRSSMIAQTNAAKRASEKSKEDSGLLTAVTKAVKTVGEDTPESLTASVDEKLDAAAEQVQRQFDSGIAQGYIQHFLLAAVPGWLLALGLAFAASAAPWLRRSRARLADAIRSSRHAIGVFRVILTGALWRCLPLICGAVVIGAWPILTGMSTAWARVFLAVAVPGLVAGVIWQLVSALLALLGPSRGWRRVGYAQRRLVPWVSALCAAASTSAILRSPFIWGTLSADVADLAAAALDLGIGGFTIAFIAKYRLLVRSLIVRRHTASIEPKDSSPLWRVILMLAKRWHIIGILFVLAHMIARLFGANVDFIFSSVLSLLVIIVGLMIGLSVDARLANRAKRLERYRAGVARRIRARYLHIARAYAQGVLVVLISIVCLNIWGLDVTPWLQSETGWAIVRPVLAMLAALTVGWMLWIALDSCIDNALSSVDRYGRTRAQSSRTKTLLPLVRNVIFIALCVILLIAVLANLGINVAPLLAGAGIVGLAVGFGSQQLVQDLITGLFILFEGTIAVGDMIDTGDRAGVVEALTIRTARIRDADGALHSIPFSQITALKNRSRDYGVYTVKATVEYGSDLDRVMEIMRQIGKELQTDPKFSWEILAPFEIWGVDQFAPEGVVIMGAIKTRPLKQWGVGREFNLRLKKRFDEAGIGMAVSRLSLVTSPTHDAGDRKTPVIGPAPSAS